MCGNIEPTQVNTYLAPGKGGSAKGRNMMPSVVSFCFCLPFNFFTVSPKIDFLGTSAENRTFRIVFTLKTAREKIFTMFTFQNCASLMHTFSYV